jgi:hypothetical protein
MARIRKDGTILLNEIQFATYTDLLTHRDENGVIPTDVVASYKQNVIKGIVKHGALEWFRKTNLRAPKNPVNVIEQPAPVSRSVAEEPMQLAA